MYGWAAAAVSSVRVPAPVSARTPACLAPSAAAALARGSGPAQTPPAAPWRARRTAVCPPAARPKRHTPRPQKLTEGRAQARANQDTSPQTNKQTAAAAAVTLPPPTTPWPSHGQTPPVKARPIHTLVFSIATNFSFALASTWLK